MSDYTKIKESFFKLEKELKISFRNKDLLVQAFCHRSFVNENKYLGLKNNERLEFLGDAVLELIVTEYIFLNFSGKSEGVLTNWRAALVNTKTLSKTAKKIGFDKFILLSKGQKKDKGKAMQCILAGNFEAFLGALYLDQGYKKCDAFIKKYLLGQLPEIIKNHLVRDSKSLFQEKTQENERITPIYRVIKEWGPDNARHFVVGVYLKNHLVSQGEGLSKKEAEEVAAKRALKLKNYFIK